MLYTIFLIGYGNQIPEQFLERLELASDECLVLDIRVRRKSWAQAYSVPNVEPLFKKRGHDYIWVYALGNTGNNHKVQLADEIGGMWQLERLLRSSRLPIVLMCCERLSSGCHRQVVAEKLSARLVGSGDSLEIRKL